MGTCKNLLNEAVITSTHNLCFREKKKKIIFTPVNPSFLYKSVGGKGVYITRTCKHDEVVVFRHEREDVMLCFVSKSKIITFSLKWLLMSYIYFLLMWTSRPSK